ncbi:hypothetical protein [Haloarcula marina]|uniref:hypothetical protein n=1 Tax=Haloarcula marina TaxID=2961574 RepID=UPI0020B72DB9|nr:hypothetical protein [Halomicroarcula marina]
MVPNPENIMNRRDLLKSLGVLGVGATGTSIAPQVSLASPTVLDDFEDGDLSEYSGDTGSFSITSNPVHTGSSALDSSVDRSLAVITHDSASISAGSEFSFHQYVRTQTDAGIQLFTNAIGTDGYQFVVQEDQNVVKIRRFDGGSKTKLAESSATIPTGEWVTNTITTDTSGNLTWVLEDSSGSQLAQVSATDSTYTYGSFGFRVWESAAFDYLTESAGSGGSGSGNGWQLNGAGDDIYGSADHCHFAYEQVSGDTTIQTRVTRQEATHDWAKAGVMIRDSLSADAKNAMMYVTPDNPSANGSRFQWRSSTGGSSSNTDPNDGVNAPYWVKIERVGDTLTGYNSRDGQSWTEIGSVTISMTDPYIGLAVTSGLQGTLCTSNFDEVSGIGQSSYSSIDIGSPGASGSTSLVDLPPKPNFSTNDEVFAPANANYSPGDEFIFPSVIETSNLDNPLGQYYLYCAPHGNENTRDGNTVGVALFYSDSLDGTLEDGTWTEYSNNPIVPPDWNPHYQASHVSSPHAMWNDEHGQLFLYFHGDNDTTRYATSSDGINFTYGGVAIDTTMDPLNSSESSYARVFEHSLPKKSASQQYLMLFMDNQSGTRHIRAAYSDDAKNWTIDDEEVIDPDNIAHDNVGNVSGPFYFEWDGTYYVTFHADGPSTSQGQHYIAEVGENLDKENHLGIFRQALSDRPDYERCASPYFYTTGSSKNFDLNGDKLYMFYEAGGRTTASIGRDIINL